MTYKDGEPCKHPGCLNHVTHPCEGCGRIAGIELESFTCFTCKYEGICDLAYDLYNLNGGCLVCK